MSVFEALKGKISTVQQDISASFKSMRTSAKTKRPRKSAKVQGVDLDAGADLLHRFSENWVEIAKASETNAKEAETVDKMIAELFHQCTNQNEAMNQLMSLVSGLPDLVTKINSAMDKLGLVSEETAEIENLLVELEDICERDELRQNKLHHEYQLSLYRQRKNVDLEQLKVNLAREHSQQVQGYEVKMKALLKERQQAFDQAFSKELQHYKLYGQVQASPSSTPPTQGQPLDIADISLEQDTAALDDFLKSADQIPDDDEKLPSSETDEGEESSENQSAVAEASDDKTKGDSEMKKQVPDKDESKSAGITEPSSENEEASSKIATKEETVHVDTEKTPDSTKTAPQCENS